MALPAVRRLHRRPGGERPRSAPGRRAPGGERAGARWRASSTASPSATCTWRSSRCTPPATTIPTIARPPVGPDPEPLLGSSYLDGFLQSLAPSGAGAHRSRPYAFLGHLWQMVELWRTSSTSWMDAGDDVTPFAPLGILDQTTGNTSRLPALRWVGQNVIQGGAGARPRLRGGHLGQLQRDPVHPLLHALRPGGAGARRSAPGAAAGVRRPGAPPGASPAPTGRRTPPWFDYLGNWETINHQVGSCNEFELWRKGEWLTKERTGYGNDGVFMTSDYHNNLSIQNDTPGDLQWYEGATSARGGQWTKGMNAGDPSVLMSSGAGWVYAYGDATNLYNRPSAIPANAAMDVTHDQPIHRLDRARSRGRVDDRATTKTAGRFKRFNPDAYRRPGGLRPDGDRDHGGRPAAHHRQPAARGRHAHGLGGRGLQPRGRPRADAVPPDGRGHRRAPPTSASSTSSRPPTPASSAWGRPRWCRAPSGTPFAGARSPPPWW